MGAAAREGNAALVLTASNGVTYTHLLNKPLQFQAAPARRSNRYERDSLDLSAREVIAIGGGRTEVETVVRFERQAQSLVDLLAYAADGSTVTYYPDLDIGTGYSLWLVGQGEVVGVAPEDGRMAYQEYQAPLRFRDASTSGASLEALFSPWLFRYDASYASRLVTFTRSGTVGPYTAKDGVLGSAAANIPRTDWLDLDSDKIFETPSLLLEPAYTNLVTSDNFDSGWTSSGTPVITASISDPAGGTAAYRIADDSGAASEYKVLNVTFTGNAVKVVVFVVREATMASSGVQRLALQDASAPATRLALDISAWTSGAPTVAASTGSYLGKRYVGNGYWALYGLSTSVTAANTNRLEVYPAETTAATGSIDVYRVNAYNAATPPWSILDASEVKALDTWYAQFPHVPQAMTVFVDLIEGQQPNFGDQWVFQIGNAAATGARFQVYKVTGGDSYGVDHVTSVTSVSASADINPGWGNRVRIRAVLNADGSVLIGAAKDTGSGFGAETVSAASSALALPSAWADTRLYLGHPTNMSTALYQSAKVAAGVKTMAEMVALFEVAA